MKKSLVQFGSALLITLGLTLPARGDNTSTSCSGTSARMTLELNSHVTLVRDLIPDDPKFYEQSIKQQLLYFDTHIKKLSKKSKIDLVFTNDEPQINIIRKVSTKSGAKMKITDVKHPDVEIKNPYVIKALKKRTIPAATNRVAIEYKAQVTAYACASSASEIDSLKNLHVKAPADPWLAHWITDESKLESVSWHNSKFKIPAYFDSEYADIPHPEFAWYFWDPNFKGTNLSGGSYDAEKKLKSHSDGLILASLKISKSLPLSSGLTFSKPFFSKDKTEILATLIYGITDAKAESIQLKQFFASSSDGRYGEWQTIRSAVMKFGTEHSVDSGSKVAIGFLNRIDDLIDEKSFKYSYEQNNNRLIIHGELRRSRMPIRINFFFGPTDVLAGEEPQHWNLAYEAIQSDDMIFYVGHSGLGENFKLENIVAHARPQAEQAALPSRDRIIGIFSCYSATYFEKDLTQLLTDNSMLVLTGSDYSSSRGVIDLLNWVDGSIAKPGKRNLSLVEDHDFLIYKRKDGKL